MAKKTAIEYEAMLGGLKRQIDDLEDQLGSAKSNWEQWQYRAGKAEKQLRHLGYAHLTPEPYKRDA